PPTLSLFPDDPYMKALQAFYTEKSPMLPPEGLLSPTKSSSSTPFQPQTFEIGETSLKTFQEAQAATMASASNPDRNTSPTRTPAVKTGKETTKSLSAVNLSTLMVRKEQ
ncbi:hypothetical protein Tco_0203399, partial [Tanacetum coccineum]